MKMIPFFIFIFLIIAFCSIYLNKSKTNFKFTFLIFFFLSLPTVFIYLKKGGIETFTFEEKLNDIIEDVIKKTKNINEVDPKIMITFLEKKLNEDPNDIEGWLILARTSVISGYFQKGDMHYKSALKYFPDNENALLEYSILKKNTNQTESAMKLLLRLKEINPKNIRAREMIIEILFKNSKEKQALKEIKKLLEIKKEDSVFINNLKKKYNLK